MGLDVRDVRPFLARWFQPVRRLDRAVGRRRRRVRYLRDGIDGICVELRNAIDCAPILREFGAKVGPDTVVYGPLHIMNAERDFSRLSIGHDAYLGTGILIDLADEVSIGDWVSIGMRTHLVTSFDVGPGPLSARRPRKQGPIRIAAGAYLGTGVTVLHGVSIGTEATVGANCLVRKDVPPQSTWVSPEAVLLERTTRD